MSSGFGIDPTKDGTTGVITSGTTSLDIRNITAGIYSPGVINGAIVSTSASNLTYNVSAGVVCFPLGTNESVLGPVPAVSGLATTAPASGSRTDIIYAQQRTPAIDGVSDVNVAVGTSLPPRSVMLGSYTVSAGQTKTSSAVKTGDINYSIPYGAGLGLIWQYRDTTNGTYTGRTTFHTHTNYLPTQRLIRITVATCHSAGSAVGFDNAHYCEAGFDVVVDGTLKTTHQTPGLMQAWGNYQWSDYYVLGQGTHIFSYDRYRITGPGSPYQHYGGGRIGTLISVEDVGPVV